LSFVQAGAEKRRSAEQRNITFRAACRDRLAYLRGPLYRLKRKHGVARSPRDVADLSIAAHETALSLDSRMAWRYRSLQYPIPP
jgi:hypothetical protein